MILTVTLNPSVDISYKFEKFEKDTTNRCSKTIKTAGGKGINVARVLKQLGGDVITTGFLGGDLGNFIKKELDKTEIKNDFLFTDKPTRNCIAILDDESQTEILESGEMLEQSELDDFLQKYALLCKKVNIVCISGSAPKGINSDFVEQLIKTAKENKCVVIADMSGKLLEDIITKFTHKPYAIKPNIDEFKEFIGKKSEKEIDIKSELLANTSGIDFVMLSSGADGSYIKYMDKVYKADIPKVDCVNPVGSGDSTVAGIAYSLDFNLDIQELIKIANACGISNCMSDMTGCIDISQVEDLKKRIYIREL